MQSNKVKNYRGPFLFGGIIGLVGGILVAFGFFIYLGLGLPNVKTFEHFIVPALVVAPIAFTLGGLLSMIVYHLSYKHPLWKVVIMVHLIGYAFGLLCLFACTLILYIIRFVMFSELSNPIFLLWVFLYYPAGVIGFIFSIPILVGILVLYRKDVVQL